MPELQEYVTVQTHDAQLGRIEALMEANLAHQELIASELRGEIRELRGEIRGLHGEIKALDAKIDGVDAKIDAKIDGVMDAIAITNSRIDDLHDKNANTVALWAIFAAVTGVFITTVLGVYQLFLR